MLVQNDALNYIEGDWIEGNPPIIGPMSHGAWMGSPVFDGARVFDSMAPDLDEHCARLVDSTERMLMNPPVTAKELLDISLDGIRKFGSSEELYIRPLVWAEQSNGLLRCVPESARFCVTIVQMPMPPEDGLSACLATEKRPAISTAPTDAKAACLYPNFARSMQKAHDRGYDNAVICDLMGNVAEFASANLFAVIDGICTTPIPNGTFLDGVTRRRVIALLRNDRIEVIERMILPEELNSASEIFSTGNFGKVMHVNRYEDTVMQPGPVYQRARKLYWRFAKKNMV